VVAQNRSEWRRSVAQCIWMRVESRSRSSAEWTEQMNAILNNSRRKDPK